MSGEEMTMRATQNGQKPRTRSENRRLNSTVSVRLAPAEEAKIRADAESHGETVSSYLRRLALEGNRSGGHVTTNLGIMTAQLPKTCGARMILDYDAASAQLHLRGDSVVTL